jgi:hypothetical protein
MEINKVVLFVHGGGEGAHEEDEKLAASLRDALGGAYEVRSPKMPNEGSPEVGAHLLVDASIPGLAIRSRQGKSMEGESRWES